MLLGTWMSIGFLSIGFGGGSKYVFMFFVDLKFYIELVYFFFLNEIIRVFEICHANA